jgi:hypothetical protein
MTSPDSIDPVLFERILQTAASPSAIDQLCRKHNLKFRRGIYHLAVVVWLMIYQRLHGKGTRSAAVHFLAHQVVHWQAQPHMSKRVREDRISTRTGGYCQARQKMPTLVASHVCDHISEQLQGLMREQMPDVPRPMFVIDGTTLRLPHERELVRAFPPGHNQHGENHWPTLLLVAFHDVHTAWPHDRVGARCMASGRSANRNWRAKPYRDCPPMRSSWRMATLGSSHSPMPCSKPSAPCCYG